MQFTSELEKSRLKNHVKNDYFRNYSTNINSSFDGISGCTTDITLDNGNVVTVDLDSKELHEAVADYIDNKILKENINIEKPH